MLLDNQVAEISVGYSLPIRCKDRITITTAGQAERLFRGTWNTERIELQETFKVMLLNGAHHCLGIVTVSDGGRSSVHIDVRLLLGIILKSAAVAVIFAHNHPSGTCRPSSLDHEFHGAISEKCSYFNIAVLDHIILTADGYYSYASEEAHESE